MKLYIDTSDREKVVIGIDDKRFETEIKEKSSRMILPFIDEVLKSERKDLSDIQQIEVNPGPGSFTGIRIGVAIANTLGFVLKVPVNGKKNEVDIQY